jgi:hypothetical protein
MEKSKKELLELFSNMEPIRMDIEELEMAKSPFGRAIIKNDLMQDEEPVKEIKKIKPGRKSENSKYKYVECDICGKRYCTSNAGKHKATQYHMICANLNKKMKKLIIGDF